MGIFEEAKKSAADKQMVLIRGAEQELKSALEHLRLYRNDPDPYEITQSKVHINQALGKLSQDPRPKIY